jgi:pimeloyl-ACP methyl ester carboxylesterase
MDGQEALVERGALRSLRTPVSIIFGQGDRYLTPALASEMADLFEDPSLHLVKDAGHWPQDDQPVVVAELLKG